MSHSLRPRGNDFFSADQCKSTNIVAYTRELLKVCLGIKTCCEVSCCFENDTITTTDVFDNNDDNSFNNITRNHNHRFFSNHHSCYYVS